MKIGWHLFLAAPLAAAPLMAQTLKVERAVYTRDAGALQIVLAFDNKSDSVLYLDCQGRPQARAQGKTLVLSFSGAGDSTSAAEIPARVAPRRLFKLERKLSVKLPGTNLENPSIDLDLEPFATLRVEAAYYPERVEGEGSQWVVERAVTAAAKPVVLAKKGKKPSAPGVRRHREYVPAPPPGD